MTPYRNATSLTAAIPTPDTVRRAALCALLVTGISGWHTAHGLAAGHTSPAVSPITHVEEDAPAVPSRIVPPIDETRLVQLRGNTHSDARPECDQGSVDPQLAMHRMILLLKRSPEQEAALAEFMTRQLDPASPDFHRSLDPVDFGKLFGPSNVDLEVITIWLQIHDFSVDEVSKSREFILFSGSAALVKRAFHTEIHRYDAGGVEHITNNSDPSIPEALSPVIAGVDLTGISLAESDLTSLTSLNICGSTLAPETNCLSYVAFRPAAACALSSEGD